MLHKLVENIKEVVEESNKMYNALQGLIEVAKGVGVSMTDASNAAQDMASRGFMSITESAKAYKTALAMGLGIEETTNLINAMADAAAYNRQAHYSWGESIVVAMEGIKNGNSTLTDSVGVTKNLSVMQKEYAKSIGTSAAKLTDAQKVQAAYNGFLAESALFAGNAERAMDGYVGTQARFEQSISSAKVALGDALKPALEDIMKTLTPLIVAFAEWAAENKSLIVGLAAGTTSMLAFIVALGSAITVVKALQVAFAGLQTSMGVLGAISLAIGVVVGGLSALIAQNNEAAEAVRKHDEAEQALNKTLSSSPMSKTVEEIKQMQEQLEELNPLIEERARLQKRLDEINLKPNGGDGPQSIDRDMLVVANDLSEAIEKLDKKLFELGHDTLTDAEEAARAMKEEIEESIPALRDMERAELAGVAAKVKHIDQVNALVREYDKLNAKEKLSEEQKSRLTNVVRDLTKEYPSLITQLDEENRWHITNRKSLTDLISAEKDSVTAAAQASKDRLANWRVETESKLKLAKLQISALEKIEKFNFSESKVGKALPGELAKGAEIIGDMVVQGVRAQAQSNTNEYQQLMNEIDKDIQAITTGAFDRFVDPPVDDDKKKKKTKTKKGKTAAELAAEARKKAYDAELKTIQFQAEMYEWSTDRQIEAYEKLRTRHEKFLKESVDDRRTLDLQVKRLGEESLQSQYDFSAEWIKQEERRMEDSGKSEEEIAKMKIAAWTRVRDRYEKDSAQYKEADEQLYQARKSLTDKTVKLAENLVKTQKSAIEDARKAELAAIEARKKAALADYDARIKAIDDLIAKEAEFNSDLDYETELREKNARIDELASAVGPEGIAEREQAIKERDRMILEHERELRKRELESQKNALKDEKDAQANAFDAEKTATEAQFDALKNAFESYSGDIKTIEAVLAQFRVSEAGKANAQILSELDTFVAQYNAKMATVTSLSSANDLAEYNANKDAWSAAKSRGDTAEMARLTARNEELRKLYGITKDTGKLQSFAVGGIVQGANGEPVIAQVHAGEMVLNARQQAALFEALSGVSSRPVSRPNGAVTQITNHIDMGVGAVTLEDQADITAFYDERARAVERMQTQGVKAI